MKYILLIILPLFVFSCKTEKVLTDAQLAKKQEKSNSNILLTAIMGNKIERNDAYTITNVQVDGNKLIVDVNFSGGCMLHEFIATGLPISNQALQPIRQIQLSHNSNRDYCERIVSLTLEIDVKPIAVNEAVGSKTIFKLDGWKEQIEYTVK